jgi:hypothetical protein
MAITPLNPSWSCRSGRSIIIGEAEMGVVWVRMVVEVVMVDREVAEVVEEGAVVEEAEVGEAREVVVEAEIVGDQKAE